MVFKVNRNIIAVLLAVCLFGAFCLIERAAPPSLQADASAEETEETLTLPVAMYHHILTTQSRLDDYVISPDEFEADLLYIQKCGYTTISCAELIAAFEEDAPLPDKPILLTFDDGFESFHEYAFPLLKKYGMKAVVSVIGYHTDLFSNPEETRHINYSHLTWEQCREMQKSGLVEIGNHTYNMHEDGSGGKRYGIRIKKGESPEDYRKALYEDVGGLSGKMEEELGQRPEVFAYPFGALCKESRPILTEMGFKIILTCEEKVNVLPENAEEPLVLKRFNRAHRYSSYTYFKKLGLVAPA